MSSIRNTLRALAVAAVSAILAVPAGPAQAEPSPEELTRRIERSSAQLERVVEAHNGLAEQIKANKATASRLQGRIGPLERQAEQSRAEVNKIAVTAYKTGDVGTAAAILRPGDASSLLDRLAMVDHLTRERQQRVVSFTDNQRRLIAEKNQLDVTLAQQAAQAREITNARKRIERDLASLYELRRQAYGRATEHPVSRPDSAQQAPAVSGSAGVAVRYAYGALGKPYRWGAAGPDGYDCSGLTSAAWRAAGKSLPHNTRMQWGVVTHIGRSDLRPGDLVFYSGLGHVGLYVGGGQIIDAPSAGRNVLKRDMNIMPIVGYGRVR